MSEKNDQSEQSTPLPSHNRSEQNTPLPSHHHEASIIASERQDYIEALHEALLDLEQARHREHESRLESEYLFSGLRILSSSRDTIDVFHRLFDTLRIPLAFEEAFILLPHEEGNLQAVITTSPIFEHTVWHPQTLFRRVLSGKPVAVFNIQHVPEWQSQPPALHSRVQSALHIPLQSQYQQALLICTHSQYGHFPHRSVQLAGKLAVLASQALLQLQMQAAILERERLFALSHDLLGIIDKTGCFKQVNPVWENVLGYPLHELQAQPFLPMLIHPQYQEKLSHAFLTLFQKKASSVDIELLCRAKNGHFRWLRWRIDIFSEAELLYVVAQDITERKKEAEQVVGKAHQAGMAEIAIRVLHNVGNVLNSIMVATATLKNQLHQSRLPMLDKTIEMLEKNTLPPPPLIPSQADQHRTQAKAMLYLRKLSETLQEEHNQSITEVSLIAERAYHITEIVAEQQNYAHQGTPLQSLLDMVQLIRDVVKIQESFLQQHNITIVYRLPDHFLCVTERAKLMQILVNLLKNGIEAILQRREQHPDLTHHSQITFRLDLSSLESSKFRLYVIDTGIGIDIKESHRIFAYGFSTKSQGRGVGLHYSINAVQEMGGDLFFESQGRNQGTTFILDLPYITPTEA